MKRIGKKRKKKLPANYKLFGFPAYITSGGANLTVYENIGAVIENYGSIQEYNERVLCLKTRIGLIKICGEGLLISETDAGSMSLSGRIESICFEYDAV